MNDKCLNDSSRNTQHVVRNTPIHIPTAHAPRTMPEPTDSLLIALLPQPVDRERAHEGWYRVPVARAPGALYDARALAFYQPASFGEERWRVAWWAEVRGLRECPRRQLIPDEPEHHRADEPYVVVELGPLQPVEPPKRAEKGRRLLFLPTTWAAFQAAPSLDALLEPAPRPIADDLLYRLIQQQLAGSAAPLDPALEQQRRLLEAEQAEYDALDW